MAGLAALKHRQVRLEVVRPVVGEQKIAVPARSKAHLNPFVLQRNPAQVVAGQTFREI